LARGARLLAALLLALAAASAARADAPTADEIVARAQALGVGEQARALREHFLPGARMVDIPGRAAVGATRLGGLPGLPRGTRWPTCNGRKLSFLLQVRVADVPGAGGSGLLSVFADLKLDRDGVETIISFAGRVKPGSCVAVLHSSGALHRRATPRGVKELRDTAVELRPTLTVPGWDAAEYFGVPDIPIDPWGELTNEASEGVLSDKNPFTPFHLLGGWSWSIQWEVETACGDKRTKAPERRLLLQLDWDEHLRFTYADAGVLYINIPPQDLRAGRFDRLCAEFQFS
jgi:hypothetical protein